MKMLTYYFIKNSLNLNYIIIMKKLSYFLIFFVWTFILTGHSKAEINNSKLVLNNDKLISPILYIKKIINKEIEKTKKYQIKQS